MTLLEDFHVVKHCLITSTVSDCIWDSAVINNNGQLEKKRKGILNPDSILRHDVENGCPNQQGNQKNDVSLALNSRHILHNLCSVLTRNHTTSRFPSQADQDPHPETDNKLQGAKWTENPNPNTPI